MLFSKTSKYFMVQYVTVDVSGVLLFFVLDVFKLIISVLAASYLFIHSKCI